MAFKHSPRYKQGSSHMPDNITMAGHNKLVSCVMPTSGRAIYLKQSMIYFLQQDYPDKELIIVYNNESDLPGDFELPGNVRLVQTTARSIGAKRNLGCKYAQGSMIAQWDDDDLYNKNRLSRQVLPLLKENIDMTGLHNFIYYDLQLGKCFFNPNKIHDRYFPCVIATGTLVFKKRVWGKLAFYPDVFLGEDSSFFDYAIKKRVRFERIDGVDTFIYLRHPGNTWRPADLYSVENGSINVPLPDWAQPYEPFYKTILSEKTCN